VQQLVDDNRRLQKEIETLKGKLANASGSDLMSGLKEINGVHVLSTVVEGADAKSLRSVADQVRSKLGKGVFLLAAVEGGKAALVAGVTNNLTDSLKAGDLLKHVTAQVGGKGGGRPDMAQGAATDISALPAAMESVYSWVEQNIS
jgi:alanyl-tRNA synthetase